MRRVLTLFRRPPDFMVGGRDDPYMLRWWIIPRNRFFNIYLHKFLRDDEDRALHDHPWISLSIIIKGSYYEYLPDRKRFCRRGSVIYRRSIHRHRIELVKDCYVKSCTDSSCRWKKAVPAWTIFITGPRIRLWGFWCEGTRFVPWEQFTSPDDSGATGRGCE